MNLDETLKLGQKINVTPMETSVVWTSCASKARELASLAPLDGDKLECAYVEAMVTGSYRGPWEWLRSRSTHRNSLISKGYSPPDPDFLTLPYCWTFKC